MRSLLVFLLLSTAAVAQPRLAFEAETVDMGRFSEADGPVAHTFEFTNDGDAPLRIGRVEAACGCTTPTWTETAVEPGGGGVLEVVYDPAGRPGPFDKTIFVATEDGQSTVLRIEGVVESALARTGTRVGSLAFRDLEADAGTVPPGEPLQTSFQFANVGDRPVRIERVDAPDGVEVVMPPRPIFPDALRGLFVTVENPVPDADGQVSIDLEVVTTDADEPVKRLRIVGRVE
ncbi:DUF1573 domain-containing protein [Rubrivirga sp.]|uniref:DUF1573 domain-containing protein n=1 Tax=Rubrivirga sp. TaxID=1885344 RepID=UPI003C74BEC0